MTQTISPSITVRGAWTGSVSNPAREFAGRVTTSDLEAIPAGTPVSVNYSSPSGRTPNATEHGTYILHFAGQAITLMSFTCQAVATTGKGGHDDMEPANWQAIALPQSEQVGENRHS